jgi:hypothetical protein
MVNWLQRHPYLQTEKPEPVTIVGVNAGQWTAIVADVPASECGDTCLGLFVVSLKVDWVVYEKEKVRFIGLKAS